MLQTLMEPWVWITLAAAFAQNLRSLLQRRLASRLSTHGATYVRFVYALPVAGLVVLLWSPPLPQGAQWLAFLSYTFVGGVAQIIGTFCLVLAVSRGNFAVGTALSKSEAAQAAVFGLLVLGDAVSLALGAGIGLSFVGVCLLLSWPTTRATGQVTTAAGSWRWGSLGITFWAGLASGTGFAIAAVCFRGATISLPDGSVGQRAALTVAAAVAIQTLVHGAYIAAREPQQLRAVAQAYGPGLAVGVVGALASLGWFAAMTLESAGRVRALGQIEMVFTLLTSMVLLRERLTLRELGGLVLIVLGLLLLLN